MKINEIITEAFDDFSDIVPKKWADNISDALATDRERSDSPEKVAQFLAYIKQNCQPYFKATGGFNSISKFSLYRGLDSDMDAAQIVKVRKNRKPSDTPNKTQKLIDDWFQTVSGIRYRQSSVFATGSESQADGYGEVAIIFPVGNFSFCWSPKYADLTQNLENYLSKPENLPGKNNFKDFNSKDFIYTANAGFEFNKKDVSNSEYINAFMKNGNYQFNKNLPKAIESGHEIMINCNKVIIVWENWMRRNVFNDEI